MTAVPVTRTFVAGEVVLASYFNTNINGPINFLLAPPLLRCRQTTLQTLTNATLTAITFTTEDVDSSGMHSNVTNTSRATAVYPGWYRHGGAVGFAANATGNRLVEIAVNGTSKDGTRTSSIGFATNAPCIGVRNDPVFLNVNDYAEIFGFQSSGGNLNTAVTAQEQSSFSMQWASN
jgi:hypothetical protein